MWAADGRIYFVTDRWGRPNLASMNPDGSDVKRLTQFEDYDVRWPSMGDGKIVYQHKMDIWVYDLATGENHRCRSSFPATGCRSGRSLWTRKAYLKGWALSKDGERIVLETRGDIFVDPHEEEGPDPPDHRKQRGADEVPGVLARRQEDRRLDGGQRRGATPLARRR